MNRPDFYEVGRMRLRAKLLFLIASLMGMVFLLAALLLEGEHLRQVQENRDSALRLTRSALATAATQDEVTARLRWLEQAGVVEEWRVLSPAPEAPHDNDADPFSLRLPILLQGVGGSVDVRLTTEGGSLFATELMPVLLAMLVGTWLLSAVVYFAISRLVLAPVDEMLHATRRLAEGRWPAEMALARRGDEMGRLADAFNRMVREVREARQTLEERVREATARVEKTQRDLAFSERLAATGRLAAGVAHEINNPLGGVMNAARRLRREDISPEKRAEYLDLVEEGLERIKQIVRQILDFARRTPEVVETDALVPLRRALDLLRHRVEQQGVRLSNDALVPATVCADAGELQQVFLNLLANALDAMPDGGTLTLASIAADGQVEICLRDTGCGMDAAELGMSFDRFHTTKPAGEGTGLGLSIAHDIVTRYGGSLRLESRKGDGTCAIVRLPLTEIGSGGGC